MNIAFFSGVVCASLIPSLAPVQKPFLQVADPAPCVNIHAHEPLVIYEVRGATLAGQVDQTLVVYTDGLVKLSTAAPNEAGTSATVQTTPEMASKLYEGLALAGAFSLCDEEMLVVDLPLRTVTLLRGAHEMRGRTFSFWNGYGRVEMILEDFIAEQFPN